MIEVEEQNQNIEMPNQAEEEQKMEEQKMEEQKIEEQNIEDHNIEVQNVEEQSIEDQNQPEDNQSQVQAEIQEKQSQNAEEQEQSGEEQSEVEPPEEEQNQKAESKKKTKSEKNDKNEKEKMAVLEAILFAMGDSVEVSRLAQVIEETPKKTRNLLLELQKKYKRDKRGIDLIELDDCFQMCTRPEMYEYLVKIAKVPRKYTLSDTVLETLSIVAYKQPVTRLEIEKIRGVSCDHAVNRLLEFDLIKEVGRLDAPGRPLLFGTTEQFLRSFGVKSLEELPQLNQDRVEEFREEAEQEVQLKMDI